MLPELLRFSLLGVERPLYAYPVLLLLAAVAAVLLSLRLARRDGVAAWDMLSVGLLALAGGLIGAGLLDILVAPAAFLRQPGPPGMVFFGGLLGGSLAAIAFIRRYRLPLGAVTDAAAPALALGHAIGRLGCLLGGCCHGAVATAPWPGIRTFDPLAPAHALSRGELPLHPVQLYEAAGLLLLSLALLGARRIRRARGGVFPLYLAGYALLRLATETLRGDPGRGEPLGHLSTSTIIALLVLGASVLYWLRTRRSRRQEMSTD